MRLENWHEERDRLVQLLHAIDFGNAIKSGSTIDIDDRDLRELQQISREDVTVLKTRLALLNARLGDEKI